METSRIAEIMLTTFLIEKITHINQTVLRGTFKLWQSGEKLATVELGKYWVVKFESLISCIGGGWDFIQIFSLLACLFESDLFN